MFDVAPFLPVRFGARQLLALERALDAGAEAFDAYREWRAERDEPAPLPILVFHFAAVELASDERLLRSALLEWTYRLSRSQHPN